MDNVGDVFQVLLYFNTYFAWSVSLASAEAYNEWGGKLNSDLMASCVRNICTKNYQNLLFGFQVTVENVGNTFIETVYITLIWDAVCGAKYVGGGNRPC